MIGTEQNALLTETGPGTPMGALFRRYWLPVLMKGEALTMHEATMRKTIASIEVTG